jgi:hypothetical protein
LRNAERDKSWANEYGQLLNKIRDHGVQISKLAFYAHADSDPDLLRQILLSRRSDLFFGWMSRATSSLKFDFHSSARPADDNPVIANPLAWAEATRAYLGLLALAERIEIQGKKEHLCDLWIEGLRIREAALSWGSKDFRVAAVEAYRDVTGIPLSSAVSVA